MISNMASNVEIRFFEGQNLYELENKINQQLSKTKVGIYDIRYNYQKLQVPRDEPATYVSAMIIYVRNIS